VGRWEGGASHQLIAIEEGQGRAAATVAEGGSAARFALADASITAISSGPALARAARHPGIGSALHHHRQMAGRRSPLCRGVRPCGSRVQVTQGAPQARSPAWTWAPTGVGRPALAWSLPHQVAAGGQHHRTTQRLGMVRLASEQLQGRGTIQRARSPFFASIVTVSGKPGSAMKNRAKHTATWSLPGRQTPSDVSSSVNYS